VEMDETHQFCIPINPNCCLWLTRIFLITMVNCIDGLLLNAMFRYNKHYQVS
jgi:hypothetical protein